MGAMVQRLEPLHIPCLYVRYLYMNRLLITIKVALVIGTIMALSGCYVVPPRGPVAVVQPGPVIIHPYGYWHPGWWGPWGWHRGYWHR